ncbi:hypothetical protein T484DRAFT_3635669 [Baffinella frigidus]|nr:hypothetical protein T484DRAFT_3635669 [Cryptophyta sp. CCMP2293]
MDNSRLNLLICDAILEAVRVLTVVNTEYGAHERDIIYAVTHSLQTLEPSDECIKTLAHHLLRQNSLQRINQLYFPGPNDDPLTTCPETAILGGKMHALHAEPNRFRGTDTSLEPPPASATNDLSQKFAHDLRRRAQTAYTDLNGTINTALRSPVTSSQTVRALMSALKMRPMAQGLIRATGNEAATQSMITNDKHAKLQTTLANLRTVRLAQELLHQAHSLAEAVTLASQATAEGDIAHILQQSASLLRDNTGPELRTMSSDEAITVAAWLMAAHNRGPDTSRDFNFNNRTACPFCSMDPDSWPRTISNWSHHFSNGCKDFPRPYRSKGPLRTSSPSPHSAEATPSSPSTACHILKPLSAQSTDRANQSRPANVSAFLLQCLVVNHAMLKQTHPISLGEIFSRLQQHPSYHLAGSFTAAFNVTAVEQAVAELVNKGVIIPHVLDNGVRAFGNPSDSDDERIGLPDTSTPSKSTCLQKPGRARQVASGPPNRSPNIRRKITEAIREGESLQPPGMQLPNIVNHVLKHWSANTHHASQIAQPPSPSVVCEILQKMMSEGKVSALHQNVIGSATSQYVLHDNNITLQESAENAAKITPHRLSTILNQQVREAVCRGQITESPGAHLQQIVRFTQQATPHHQQASASAILDTLQNLERTGAVHKISLPTCNAAETRYAVTRDHDDETTTVTTCRLCHRDILWGPDMRGPQHRITCPGNFSERVKAAAVCHFFEIINGDHEHLGLDRSHYISKVGDLLCRHLGDSINLASDASAMDWDQKRQHQDDYEDARTRDPTAHPADYVPHQMTYEGRQATDHATINKRVSRTLRASGIPLFPGHRRSQFTDPVTDRSPSPPSIALHRMHQGHVLPSESPTSTSSNGSPRSRTAASNVPAARCSQFQCHLIETLQRRPDSANEKIHLHKAPRLEEGELPDGDTATWSPSVSPLPYDTYVSSEQSHQNWMDLSTAERIGNVIVQDLQEEYLFDKANRQLYKCAGTMHAWTTFGKNTSRHLVHYRLFDNHETREALNSTMHFRAILGRDDFQTNTDAVMPESPAPSPPESRATSDEENHLQRLSSLVQFRPKTNRQELQQASENALWIATGLVTPIRLGQNYENGLLSTFAAVCNLLTTRAHLSGPRPPVFVHDRQTMRNAIIAYLETTAGGQAEPGKTARDIHDAVAAQFSSINNEQMNIMLVAMMHERSLVRGGHLATEGVMHGRYHTAPHQPPLLTNDAQALATGSDSSNQAPSTSPPSGSGPPNPDPPEDAPRAPSNAGDEWHSTNNLRPGTAPNGRGDTPDDRSSGNDSSDGQEPPNHPNANDVCSWCRQYVDVPWNDDMAAHIATCPALEILIAAGAPIRCTYCADQLPSNIDARHYMSQCSELVDRRIEAATHWSESGSPGPPPMRVRGRSAPEPSDSLGCPNLNWRYTLRESGTSRWFLRQRFKEILERRQYAEHPRGLTLLQLLEFVGGPMQQILRVPALTEIARAALQTLIDAHEVIRSPNTPTTPASRQRDRQLQQNDQPPAGGRAQPHETNEEEPEDPSAGATMNPRAPRFAQHPDPEIAALRAEAHRDWNLAHSLPTDDITTEMYWDNTAELPMATPDHHHLDDDTVRYEIMLPPRGEPPPVPDDDFDYPGGSLPSPPAPTVPAMTAEDLWQQDEGGPSTYSPRTTQQPPPDHRKARAEEHSPSQYCKFCLRSQTRCQCRRKRNRSPSPDDEPDEEHTTSPGTSRKEETSGKSEATAKPKPKRHRSDEARKRQSAARADRHRAKKRGLFSAHISQDSPHLLLTQQKEITVTSNLAAPQAPTPSARADRDDGLSVTNSGSHDTISNGAVIPSTPATTSARAGGDNKPRSHENTETGRSYDDTLAPQLPLPQAPTPVSIRTRILGQRPSETLQPRWTPSSSAKQSTLHFHNGMLGLEPSGPTPSTPPTRNLTVTRTPTTVWSPFGDIRHVTFQPFRRSSPQQVQPSTDGAAVDITSVDPPIITHQRQIPGSDASPGQQNPHVKRSDATIRRLALRTVHNHHEDISWKWHGSPIAKLYASAARFTHGHVTELQFNDALTTLTAQGDVSEHPSPDGNDIFYAPADAPRDDLERAKRSQDSLDRRGTASSTANQSTDTASRPLLNKICKGCSLAIEWGPGMSWKKHKPFCSSKRQSDLELSLTLAPLDLPQILLDTRPPAPQLADPTPPTLRY